MEKTVKFRNPSGLLGGQRKPGGHRGETKGGGEDLSGLVAPDPYDVKPPGEGMRKNVRERYRQ